MINILNESNNCTLQLKLSICIATYNRGRYIIETLDSILGQTQPGVELVIVDGASTDNTSEVMSEYVLAHPEVNYIRESSNSGVDRDYDKAVSYASGEYCWLMTDDDILEPTAISRVLENIRDAYDLIIVNSGLKSVDLSKTVHNQFLKFDSDRVYTAIDKERFFAEVAGYLSFIGGVVIKRSLWLARDRASYYGTLFIHVGTIFQHPAITNAKVISDPLINIRLGNSMWSPRGFEIWMFKWPQLIWGFVDFSEKSKAMVVALKPWLKIQQIIYYRAIGGYNSAVYRDFISKHVSGSISVVYRGIAVAPASAINLFAGLYCVLINRKARGSLYYISIAKESTWLTRWLARFL
jgi:abequosyltransferase